MPSKEQVRQYGQSLEHLSDQSQVVFILDFWVGQDLARMMLMRVLV